MSENLLPLLVMLSPLLFVITAVVSWFQPGRQPSGVIISSMIASVSSIFLAAFCGFLVSEFGLLESKTMGLNGFGFSIRLDSLSALIFAMINLISFVVLKYSFNYLDGDERQGIFIGRLAATIASVQLLVLSGNLGLLFLSWVLTSFFLHRLLKFYPNRYKAVVAARKKFIAARTSDAFLLAALVLLYNHFGTGNLELIFASMSRLAASTAPAIVEIAAVLIALAAIFKSAQFPAHGWLIEVMETPTPVSALLHAGLLNAGPFLVVRMVFVMTGSSYGPMLLIVLGGFTALFASVSYLTQTSVKTALGYSSISHMGFSLLMCGLGAYSAAMLHLVAHSFYKAHAFLSSGSAVDVLKASGVPLPKRLGSPVRMLGSIAGAFVVFAGLAVLWGIDPVEELALLAIGAIIFMGISILITATADASGSWGGMGRAAFLALCVATAFFSLEAGMGYLLQTQIPALARPSLPVAVLIAGIVLIFGGVVLVQIISPLFPSSPFWRKWAIHMRNGLYANALYDRLVGALYIKTPKARLTESARTAIKSK